MAAREFEDHVEDVEPTYEELRREVIEAKSALQIQRSENQKLQGRLAESRESAGLPAKPVEPSEPAPWWADEFRMDNRYADNHPRNTPGTAEFNAAREQKVKLQIHAEGQRLNAITAEMDKVVGKDQYGNPLTGFAVEAIKAANLTVEELFPSDDPVYREDGVTEILDPSKPLDSPINDPEDALYRRELEKRHQSRWLRRYEENRQAGLPFEPYRPPEYVPSEREQQIAWSREKIREAVHKAVGTTPQAEADKQRRINELLLAGDLESRKLAHDIIDGRA